MNNDKRVNSLGLDIYVRCSRKNCKHNSERLVGNNGKEDVCNALSIDIDAIGCQTFEER